MFSHWKCLPLTLLLAATHMQRCSAQETATAACATFASNGALATGTIRNSADLEIQLSEPGVAPIIRTVSLNHSRNCGQIFSSDGHWLATVVYGDPIRAVVLDRKTGLIFHQLAISTSKTFYAPGAPPSTPSLLAGFLPDDSLAFWAYIPNRQNVQEFPPLVDRHLQRWSIDGEFLSDQPLGVTRVGMGPFVSSDLTRLWVPATCTACYREFVVSGNRFTSGDMLMLPNNSLALPASMARKGELLNVAGGRDAQKATLLDLSGKQISKANLPFFPNLLVPFAVDWLTPQTPRLSPDGQIAAIARSREAWVLIDTDRDWGSEIILLDTDPLRVITTYRTGLGGIKAVAVDHHGGSIRLIGFWRDGWHKIRWEQESSGKWKEIAQ